jgi:hypothetical protein
MDLNVDEKVRVARQLMRRYSLLSEFAVSSGHQLAAHIRCDARQFYLADVEGTAFQNAESQVNYVRGLRKLAISTTLVIERFAEEPCTGSYDLSPPDVEARLSNIAREIIADL